MLGFLDLPQGIRPQNFPELILLSHPFSTHRSHFATILQFSESANSFGREVRRVFAGDSEHPWGICIKSSTMNVKIPRWKVHLDALQLLPCMLQLTHINIDYTFYDSS